MVGEGDLVIVLAYHTVSEEDARSLRPRLVYVDGANRIMRVGSERLTQEAALA
jgi:aspartate 1-decarboxylase